MPILLFFCCFILVIVLNVIGTKIERNIICWLSKNEETENHIDD